MPAHAVEMVGPGGDEDLAAGGRDPREEAAGVLLAALADDEVAALEPVDEPGQPAAAEQQPLGELAHPQASVLGLGEVEQHLVGGERQVVRPLELLVEVGDDLAMGAKEAPPGRELALFEVDRFGRPSVGSRREREG